MSDQELKKLEDAKTTIREELKELELEDDKKSRVAKLQSIRTWTNGQILVVRGFLFTTLGWVAKETYLNTNFLEIREQWGYYLAMITLAILLIFTFQFEKWNNDYDDSRKKREKSNKIQELSQHLSMLYLFDKILPDPELRLEQKMTILQKIPLVIQQVSGVDIEEQVRNGFQVMADTLISVREVFDLKTQQLRSEVKSVLDQIVSEMGILKSIPDTNKAMDEALDKVASAETEVRKVLVKPKPVAVPIGEDDPLLHKSMQRKSEKERSHLEESYFDYDDEDDDVDDLED